MPNNPTDNEVKKALEWLKNKTKEYCEQCAYKNSEVCDICVFDKIKLALDLINRYEAEKEALISGQETLQKYIATLQAENERLTHITRNLIDEIKAEAYTEFAERLCEGKVANDKVVIEAKCLLKEMVGNDNETIL